MRYLLGETTSDERERLVALLQQPDCQKMFEDMDAAWREDPKNWKEGFDLDGAGRKVLDSINQKCIGSPTSPSAADASEHEASRAPSPTSGFSLWRKLFGKRYWSPGIWMGLTATTAVLALTIGLVSLSRQTPPSAMGNEASNIWIEQTNGIGERLMLTLDEGTKITLNAGSTLQYPKTFSAKSRVVRLSGEAFFNVSHDQARPFIVETSTLRITVLGTRFNVKAFPDGTIAQVMLVQGKVEVTPIANSAISAVETKPVTLSSGMQYTLVPATQSEQVAPVADEAAMGWMSDKIVWNREPLPDAMRELERRYGITVEMNDTRLANETVTGRFQSESIQNIFKLLAATGGIDYRIDKNNGKVDHVTLWYVSEKDGP
ncbi:FecR domain-containing protein [Termitidicoccus mucosus]